MPSGQPVQETLVGFRPNREGGFTLTPNLPRAWLTPGKTFEVTKLRCGAARFTLSYSMTPDGLEVRLEAEGAQELSLGGRSGNPLTFAAKLGASYTITVEEEI